MMLQLITERDGRALANDVSEQFIHPRIRDTRDSQRMAIQSRLGVANERLIAAVAEGRYKVYILDEAHQLTDAAWNALLKLIEEPPPHLVFVFCTTDLAKVLPTVRSRCQTFVFARPRLPELVRVLRRIADAEKIEAPDAALALIARGARGSFRDAVSTLDQLASATGNTVDVQSVLQLLGAVEEDALFRLCDAIVDRDTAGALVFLEELSEQGQDLGRLVTDLLEHLRHLLLVQHMGHVPDSLPITDETRERLKEQANQLPAPTVLRLCDLLAVAVEDSRQGADPRLPLELALVKVTRPESDLSRESLAFRVDQLEQRSAGGRRHGRPAAPAAERPPPSSRRPWRRSRPRRNSRSRRPRSRSSSSRTRGSGPSSPPSSRARSPSRRSSARRGPPRSRREMLTLEFPASADFHRRQAEEPRNVSVIRDALYEVTGHRLAVTLALGDSRRADDEEEDELTEDALISMFKDTFDATGSRGDP